MDISQTVSLGIIIIIRVYTSPSYYFGALNTSTTSYSIHHTGQCNMNTLHLLAFHSELKHTL